MAIILSAFASGLIFGLGLVISQMINPAKVLAFLDIFGRWDPSLAFVMGGAVAVSALGYAYSRSRGAPVLAPRLDVPSRRDVDPRLLTGAAIFGLGWGLVGLCPGPALVDLVAGPWTIFVFVTAMVAGLLLARISLPSGPPQQLLGETAPAADG
ncbi:YeeE/YedE family protein [Microvirga subterranea]|uniref:Sulphur transport domain-containing protein n=1 Tax=Microvirga subterranea TaxID=186651 RepID=A0A370HSQ0_9HYPH|nr:YeeE/YedE family protein [Microvirga subterranea]RDI59984.1 hypothetical protein DES45_103242 [Microvirga subterranea]